MVPKSGISALSWTYNYMDCVSADSKPEKHPVIILMSIFVCFCAVTPGIFGSRLLELWHIFVLQSGDEEARQRSAEVLGNIGSRIAVPMIKDIIINEQHELTAIGGAKRGEYPFFVYCMALKSIGEASDKAILEMLADPDPTVRWYGAMALSRPVVERNIDTMVRALKDTEGAGIPTLNRLVELGDVAVPKLKLALDDAEVRYWAKNVIERISLSRQRASAPD